MLLFLFQRRMCCYSNGFLLSTSSLHFRGFQFAQAMLFAIEEINNSTDLLPGISLGYMIYDACGSIARGVSIALALANGNEVTFAPSEAQCTRPAQVQAIMGETSSSPCMAISTVIGPFHIPLVGTNYIFVKHKCTLGFVIAKIGIVKISEIICIYLVISFIYF